MREGVLFRGEAGGLSSRRSGTITIPTACPGCGRRWSRQQCPGRNRSGLGSRSTPPFRLSRRNGPASMVRASGCRTAKVKVADPRVDLAADAPGRCGPRGLGPIGRIRVDANAAWTVEQAVRRSSCSTRRPAGWSTSSSRADRWSNSREVRQLVSAADRRGRIHPPGDRSGTGRAGRGRGYRGDQGGAARWGPGGACAVAAAAGLPVVVSSAVDTSVGLAAGLALAAALPELTYRLRTGNGRPARGGRHDSCTAPSRWFPAGAPPVPGAGSTSGRRR